MLWKPQIIITLFKNFVMEAILMSKRLSYILVYLRRKKILPEKEAIKFLVDVLKGFL